MTPPGTARRLPASPGPARPARLGDARDDRGSGSVLVLGLLAVAVLLAGVLASLTVAQAGRGRAQTAADLGAVAGAQRLLRGGTDACEVAAEVVARNGAVLAACGTSAGGVVDVRATVRVGPGDATAAARAGPASARGP